MVCGPVLRPIDRHPGHIVRRRMAACRRIFVVVEALVVDKSRARRNDSIPFEVLCGIKEDRLRVYDLIGTEGMGRSPYRVAVSLRVSLPQGKDR
jgi:hypothetical protein